MLAACQSGQGELRELLGDEVEVAGPSVTVELTHAFDELAGLHLAHPEVLVPAPGH